MRRISRSLKSLPIALVSVCLLGVFILIFSNRSPSYNGKPIEQWFASLTAESQEEKRQAEIAFDAMGAGTLDFLIFQAMADKPRPAQKGWGWIKAKILNRSPTFECGLLKGFETGVQQDRLAKAFSIVGHRAKPVTSKLSNLVSDPACAHGAAISLVAIGETAWPEVERAFQSSDVETRRVVVATGHREAVA